MPISCCIHDNITNLYCAKTLVVFIVTVSCMLFFCPIEKGSINGLFYGYLFWGQGSSNHINSLYYNLFNILLWRGNFLKSSFIS